MLFKSKLIECKNVFSREHSIRKQLANVLREFIDSLSFYLIDGVPSYRDDHECFENVHTGPKIAAFGCRNVLRWEDINQGWSEANPMIVHLLLQIESLCWMSSSSVQERTTVGSRRANLFGVGRDEHPEPLKGGIDSGWLHASRQRPSFSRLSGGARAMRSDHLPRPSDPLGILENQETRMVRDLSTRPHFDGRSGLEVEATLQCGILPRHFEGG
ncbi:uncharacterized protein EDB93DRAFT_1337256 [Suillus bovinus]|uniref:uncharacterized protein n=1 Tax=Suillus bovinus TaxID=48563 RepID=UPI001B85FE86|nr:uncharacterized protein EDB93DRAFT_1337256 [Suillus bovinus]KAG2147828.1 hypothetical protein EDB93DRAFT_1337256 [Suillus bovinus]